MFKVDNKYKNINKKQKNLFHTFSSVPIVEFE